MKRTSLIILVLLLGMSGVVGMATAVSTAAQATETTVFYDGSLGTLPTAQGLLFATALAGPTQTPTTGGVILDTLIIPIGQVHQAGYAADPALMPLLDRSIGFTVTFAVKILNETHTNDDRAGFSVLVLSDDKGGTEPVQGLELAFWENEVWAQNDASQGGYFTHGEGVAFDTTTAVTTYTLHIITDTYALAANGTPILNGPIRDYTGFEGTIDPYETPNSLGLGDDTSSAGVEVQINYVAVTVPKPAPEFKVYLPVVIRP